MLREAEATSSSPAREATLDGEGICLAGSHSKLSPVPRREKRWIGMDAMRLSRVRRLPPSGCAGV